MPLTAYHPKDKYEYKKHSRSEKFSSAISSGLYVYVQDCEGVVWIAPDGCHMHPKVLGGAKSAVAAGEVVIGVNGRIESINHKSGTFQCNSTSLLVAVGGLIRQGAKISAEAFPDQES